MATATNKQRVLNHLLNALKKNPPEEEPLSVLEQFIYALCREGATREQADQAFRALRERFFDWNEVRVELAQRELEEVLEDLPETELRAQRIISFLQEVFETTFSFDLEGLHKKGLKQAAKQLARYQAASDYIGAWVVQKTLGGHAIPVEPPTLRTLRRLGVVENGEEDLEAIRASLEHLVPKARGAQFVDAVSDLAMQTCWEEAPNCQACPLHAECPTGQEAAPAVRPKPR